MANEIHIPDDSNVPHLLPMMLDLKWRRRTFCLVMFLMFFYPHKILLYLYVLFSNVLMFFYPLKILLYMYFIARAVSFNLV